MRGWATDNQDCFKPWPSNLCWTCVSLGRMVKCLANDVSIDNHNNNNTRTMFMVLTPWLKVIARVHPVHVMNAEQSMIAADLWTKPTDFSHRPACKQLGIHIHHPHLLLLSPKADTLFTIPQRVKGWINYNVLSQYHYIVVPSLGDWDTDNQRCFKPWPSNLSLHCVKRSSVWQTM